MVMPFLAARSSWRFAAVEYCVHLHIQTCVLITDGVVMYDEYSSLPVLCFSNYVAELPMFRIIMWNPSACVNSYVFTFV